MAKHKFSAPRKETPLRVVTSLLDNMIEGREYESVLSLRTAENFDAIAEMRRSLDEISAIRKRPVICYLANLYNLKIAANKSINLTDQFPFSEMVSCVPSSESEVDVILVTPGGSGEQVAKFVDTLRPRFNDVAFILPDMAMSAGTIFAMSGNDILMGKNSYIGPIDPQVQNSQGHFVPAQAILTVVNDIQVRGAEAIKNGLQPDWTDLQILNRIDVKDIGNAINASKYSEELVETYLKEYKFKNWLNHSSNGNVVTDDKKSMRAKEIANKLCRHELWKTHSRGISREVAWNECRIKITNFESIPGLDNAMRRFWALAYWMCDITPIYKFFVSKTYALLRYDANLIK